MVEAAAVKPVAATEGWFTVTVTEAQVVLLLHGAGSS
jgi:hypothetical protein